MSQYNKNKIKQLVAQWPRGTVHTSHFLHATGYGYDLLAKYKKNGWISSIGQGAWQLAGDDVDWRGALYTLQHELNLPVHAGGKTIIEDKGFGHYAVMGRRKCYLYGPGGTNLPRWFTETDWNVDLTYRATSLFPPGLAETFTSLSIGKLEFKASTLERAVFELLYEVPARQGYDEAQKIMDGLLTLRPGLLQTLLEKCTSIKVKRLFMVLAEQANAPWLEDLSPAKIYFGKGQRQLVREGVWNTKYQIAVPPKKDL